MSGASEEAWGASCSVLNSLARTRVPRKHKGSRRRSIAKQRYRLSLFLACNVDARSICHAVGARWHAVGDRNGSDMHWQPRLNE